MEASGQAMGQLLGAHSGRAQRAAWTFPAAGTALPALAASTRFSFGFSCSLSPETPAGRAAGLRAGGGHGKRKRGDLGRRSDHLPEALRGVLPRERPGVPSFPNLGNG